MKILIASTPATGHLNPLLAIGRILIAEGHEVVGLSGSALRERIESIGAGFRPFPPGADFDLSDIISVAPELKNTPPGSEWLRIAMERLFVDPLLAQHKGLQQVLRDFPADVIIGDDMIFGVLPMLLGPRSKRPPIVLCGTSILHWRREDKAPTFLGLPPATTPAQLEDYAAIACEHDRTVDQPVTLRLNRSLKVLGVGPLSTTLFDSVVELADAYMQLTVPSFEFPRDIPPSVRFIGALPIIPNQAPVPAWRMSWTAGVESSSSPRERWQITISAYWLSRHSRRLRRSRICLWSSPRAAAPSMRYPAQFPATRAWPAICRSNGCCRRSTYSSPTVATAASTRQ